MITTERASAYFAAYGQTLSEFDASASATLWGLPATVLTDDFAASIYTREELAEAVEQSYPLYQRLGLAGVSFDIVDTVPITAKIARVRVHWHFLDAQDEVLTDGSFEYILRDDTDGLHCYVSISIDEDEKIAELARRKGVSLD